MKTITVYDINSDWHRTFEFSNAMDVDLQMLTMLLEDSQCSTNLDTPAFLFEGQVIGTNERLHDIMVGIFDEITTKIVNSSRID